MTVSYLTKTDLNADLTGAGHLDPAVQAALISSLENSGVYDPGLPDDGKKAWVEQGTYGGGAIPPVVQVLDLTNSATVQTSSTLKGIIMDDGGGNQLYVTDTGNAHNNVFVAMGSGADSVNLFDSGNDTVHGGSGADVIGGGVGNSQLYGDGGSDTLYGGSGQDSLYGGEGDDFLRAGTGGHQLLDGGNGNDDIRDNQSGASTLSGGAGNDTIWGYGADTIHGGGGNDELHGGINSVIFSDSQAGDHTSLGSGSTASGEANSLQGGAGDDTLYGGGGNDTLTGGAGSNFLVAGTGTNQLLQAGSGDTKLYDPGSLGAAGTDTLIGGTGNDTIIGQQGDYFQDTGLAGSHNQFWVYGGTGAGSTLQGGAGDDEFHIETKVGNDTIIGGGGTDTVGFKDRSFNDVTDLHNTAPGSYTITFNDGQEVKVTGITELYFTDQAVKLT